MPKPLPINKKAVMLLARKIAENREGYNAAQLQAMLASLDRLGVMTESFEVELIPLRTRYRPQPEVVEEEPEPENSYIPKMSAAEAFGQIGGDNAATNQGSK